MEKIIFLTDPGADDALAIMAALGARTHLDVLGLVCTFGNTPLAQTARNALAILEFCGEPDIPVLLGTSRPRDGRPLLADEAFGAWGLGPVTLPEPKAIPSSLDALQWVEQTLLAEPEGTVTLVCIAPHTELARLLEEKPQVAKRLKQLLVMGGCTQDLESPEGLRRGNITREAEFNFHLDPAAAAKAFELLGQLKIRTVLFALEATHQLLATQEVREWARSHIGGVMGDLCYGLFWASQPIDHAKFGVAGAFLHDAVTVAWLLQPDLFKLESEQVRVDVKTGAVITGQGAAVQIVRGKIEAQGVMGVVIDAIAELATSLKA